MPAKGKLIIRRYPMFILSGSDVDDFARSVQEGDAASLTRLPGVGKKTAERLIIEMRTGNICQLICN